MKQLPIGFDDFNELVSRRPDGEWLYHFVDKSLFIRDILNAKSPVLITRPRRFGKTMNMSMLMWFFGIQNAEVYRPLFSGLKIAEATTSRGGREEPCMNYYGKNPVVFITLKSCAFLTFRETYGALKMVIKEAYDNHRYLVDSDTLPPERKGAYQRILNNTASDEEYNCALVRLIECLYLHHKSKVVVLIDEYDTPFQEALSRGYYDELQPMMRSMLGEILKHTNTMKANSSIELVVLTGILRISGAGLFSAANNVRSYTVLDEPFAEHFGFTETELEKLTQEIGHPDRLADFRDWYNGYQFGQTVIYNPWSVMVCISEKFDFSAHWLLTGRNSLLRDLLLQATPEIKENIARMVSGEVVSDKIVYKDLRFDEPLVPEEHLWTLLLSAGYLKAVHSVLTGDYRICQISIPNHEVRYTYTGIFANWLKVSLAEKRRSTLIERLLTGDVEAFGAQLRQFYLETVSTYDVREDYIEAFYRGFMVGVLGLSMFYHHAYLHSNRESGLGRYDLVLEPKDLHHSKYNVGIVLEFKRTTRADQLTEAAAAEQVKETQYVTDLKRRGVEKIKIISVAFCGKELQYATEVVLPAPEVVPQDGRAVEGSVAAASAAESIAQSPSAAQLIATRGAFPPPVAAEGARRRGRVAAEADEGSSAPEVDDARSKRRRGGQR